MSHSPQERMNTYKMSHTAPRIYSNNMDESEWQRVTRELIKQSDLKEADVKNMNKHCMT